MEGLRPAWAVKPLVAIIFTSILIRCVCSVNLTVGGASGWDLRSNIQAWASTTMFNIGDDLGTDLYMDNTRVHFSFSFYVYFPGSQTLQLFSYIMRNRFHSVGVKNYYYLHIITKTRGKSIFGIFEFEVLNKFEKKNIECWFDFDLWWLGSVLLHAGSRCGGSQPTRLQHVYDRQRHCHIRYRRYGDPPQRARNTLLRMWPNGPLPTRPQTPSPSSGPVQQQRNQ